jgi:hypothetical protein
MTTNSRLVARSSVLTENRSGSTIEGLIACKWRHPSEQDRQYEKEHSIRRGLLQTNQWTSMHAFHGQVESLIVRDLNTAAA